MNDVKVSREYRNKDRMRAIADDCLQRMRKLLGAEIESITITEDVDYDRKVSVVLKQDL